MQGKLSVHQRVYLDIKLHLIEGNFAEGEHLDLRLLAERFNVSTTPVRAALQFLAAERLLETSSGEGYFVPYLRETELHDLYDWMEVLLTTAVRRVEACPPPEPLFQQIEPNEGDIARRTRHLFQAIANTTGQGEIKAAVLSANDRLHRIRLTKLAVIEERDKELAHLEALWGQREYDMLSLELVAYHERRKDMVRYIVQRANGTTGNRDFTA